MSIQKLADNLYIAPQLTEADVQEAAKLGIQTVICNRPDGEEENQVTFKQVEGWLEAAGIREHHHQPVGCRRFPKPAQKRSPTGPRLLPHRHPLFTALGLSSSAKRCKRRRSRLCRTTSRYQSEQLRSPPARRATKRSGVTHYPFTQTQRCSAKKRHTN